MTRNLLIASMISVALFACDNKQEQIDRLQAANAEYRIRLDAKDSILMEFMNSINAIENNLASITEREMSISMKKVEGDTQNITSHTKHILNEIRTIDKLILENKTRIASLNSLLRQSRNERGDLHTTMNEMKVQLEGKIEEREESIAALKTELKDKSQIIEGLLADMDSLQDEIDELNAGFYVISNFRDLKEKQIVDKQGGFLGIGRSIALEDDFTDNYFSQVDIREMHSLPIAGKKVELITTHDTDSYQIRSESGDKEDESKLLVISDPEKFWEKSHYLVVLAEK